MGAWGTDGWDAGSWPYVFFATATHRDETGTLYRYGTYIEGDTYTRGGMGSFQDVGYEAAGYAVNRLRIALRRGRSWFLHG
ncbi:hypothetical protein [Arthrobacter sp. CP30]